MLNWCYTGLTKASIKQWQLTRKTISQQIGINSRDDNSNKSTWYNYQLTMRSGKPWQLTHTTAGYKRNVHTMCTFRNSWVWTTVHAAISRSYAARHTSKRLQYRNLQAKDNHNNSMRETYKQLYYDNINQIFLTDTLPIEVQKNVTMHVSGQMQRTTEVPFLKRYYFIHVFLSRLKFINSWITEGLMRLYWNILVHIKRVPL